MNEKPTKLAMEVERLSLLFTVRSLLENASSIALKKVRQTLRESANKGERGHPRIHSEELILDVHARVRAEIGQLKATGRKRPGPKSAIQSLVRKRVLEKEGPAGIDRQEARIKKVTDDIFKVYEAGRKRG